MMVRKEVLSKKSAAAAEQPLPRSIQRADIAPISGYAIVVDGHYKTEFPDGSAAMEAARGLLKNYPMLKVEVYDAQSKLRSLVN